MKQNSVFGLLDERLMDKVSFENPTPIQRLGIPAVLARKNVLFIAETGSGKTEAAVFPIFHHILDKRPISCVYITPLKALNRDIVRRLVKLGEDIGLVVEVRHGDTSNYVRRQQAINPPNMLITTPETLQILLTGKRIREFLRHVEFVVVDEIHELIEDKRGTQLSVGLERLRLLSSFTLIGISATVGSPEIVSNFLIPNGNIEIITAKEVKNKNVVIEIPDITKSAYNLADEIHTSSEVASKLERIQELSQQKGTIVFVNTRSTAEILSSRLKQILDIDVHHSSLSKQHRLSVEAKFKIGDLSKIVATSSLELGIDIGHIERVVQYGSPRSVSTFTQRLGRSGHSLNRTSKGIILSDIWEAPEAAVIGKFALKGKLEPTKTMEEPLDVLAHQLVGISLSQDFVNTEAAFKLFKKTYPFRNLDYSMFNDVIDLLAELGFIYLENGRFRRRRRVWKYYFSNISTIPSHIKYILIDAQTRKRVGYLDDSFVNALQLGESFVVAGNSWTLSCIEDRKVFANLSGSMAEAASWAGDLMPVHRMVASQIPDAIRNPNKYPISKNAVHKIKSLGEYESNVIRIEHYQDLKVIITWAGNRINNSLAHLLAGFLTTEFGESVGVKSDQYAIIIKGRFNQELLESIDVNKIERGLRLVLSRAPIYRRRFVNVAKRFGVIDTNARLDKFGLKRLISIWQGSLIDEEAQREVLREKMDLSGTREFVNDIKSGKLAIKSFEHLSEFGKFLVSKFYPEIIGVNRPKSEVMRLLKQRLENKVLPIMCFYCKSWYAKISVKNIPDKCPFCGAKKLSIVYEPKLLKRRDLNVKEKRELQKIRKTAGLVLSHGKDAFLVLAARGVGPNTAGRILLKAQNQDEMLDLVLKSEKQYARTKPFWN
ncbi:MAG: DEAD/DEAH box helicase [Candidatus Altiarchaeota archaeon]|nr:DEAD/DEAH box helicase [Candidatus Altiarchaeota archaeon]